MNINNINFRAKPINKSLFIKKYDLNKNQYTDFQVAFVKLDKDNKNDIIAVDEATKHWNDGIFIKRIATASHWMKTVPIDIYALTSQSNNFDKLDYKQIIGFAEMRDDNMQKKYKWLHYLEVKYDAIKVGSESKNKYKYAGSTILSSLKKIYKNISLFSVRHPNIEKFYRQNGFIEDYMGCNHYVWNSSKLKMMLIKFKKFRLQFGY